MGGGVNLFMKDKWFNPFLATGNTQVYMDEFNNDNFDHTNVPVFSAVAASAAALFSNPADQRAARAAGHTALGHGLEESQCRLVRSSTGHRHAGQLLRTSGKTTSISTRPTPTPTACC